jgi:hypothetical protein
VRLRPSHPDIDETVAKVSIHLKNPISKIPKTNELEFGFSFIGI